LRRWERYQVWNRKAANPTFKKLWGKNSGESLPPGLYTIKITDTWDAVGFGGTKAFVIADVGAVGPRNDFVGRMFIAVAGTCLLAFVVVGVYRPREMGDLDLVSWKRE
jgi:LEM3 (ligand-effect modulator 3) family / CDC50 family